MSPSAELHVVFGGDATPLREAVRQTVAWARSSRDRTPGAVQAAHAAPIS